MTAALATPIPVHAGEFEGPLDLLLELVRRNQVSIETMPIAEITRQYLAYMKEAERASVNLGAEFIYMAATLIQIKSRLLLPQDPALNSSRRTGSGGGVEEEDPQKALLARLREHAQARAAAEMLKTKLEVEETTWSHHEQQAVEFGATGQSLVVDRLTATQRQPTLADLIDTLGDALRRVRSHSTMAVEMDPFTVEDRIDWLRDKITRTQPQRRIYKVSDLFGQQPSQTARCCLFLGILELGRDGELRIDQSEPFGEVTIARA